MERETYEAYKQAAPILWAFCIAAFAGLVNYLQRLTGKDPEPWKWGVAVTKVLTAGFVGLLTRWLLQGWNLPEHYVDFSLGVAGYGGVETIVFFQSIFQDTVRRAAGASKNDDATH